MASTCAARYHSSKQSFPLRWLWWIRSTGELHLACVCLSNTSHCMKHTGLLLFPFPEEGGDSSRISNSSHCRMYCCFIFPKKRGEDSTSLSNSSHCRLHCCLGIFFSFSKNGEDSTILSHSIHCRLYCCLALCVRCPEVPDIRLVVVQVKDVELSK